MSDSDPRTLRSWPHRVLAVFFSPGNLFEQLRRKPVWGGLAFLVVFLHVVAQTVEVMAVVRLLADADAIHPISDRFGVIGARGLMATGFIFATAGFMFLVFATVLGDNGRYEHYLSITVHASLVPAIGSLLMSLLDSSLSFGSFLPFPDDGFLRVFLSHLHPFTLWAVVLAALGVSKIQPGRSWWSALAVLVISWIVAANTPVLRILVW